MNLRAVRLLAFGFVVCLAAIPSNADSAAGTIAGVVVDHTGTPQMGATVLISSEQLVSTASVKLFTNGKGGFTTASLPTGLYSIQVTLAGFLPTIAQHVEVSDAHATLLQLVMGSVLTSLSNLHQTAQKQGAADDWVWVLRSAPGARSVLRWDDSSAIPLAAAQENSKDRDHAFLEVSSGADRPGSIANSPVAPGTAFAYDVSIGPAARLLMAGQFSHQGQASATGIAAEWLPTGEAQAGPLTTLVVRQTNDGPGGPVFRAARISHDNEMALGDRVSLRYGGEFIFAGFGRGTAVVRPRAEMAFEMAPSWQMSVVMATHPWNDALGNSTDDLQAAVDTFDAFPTVMMRRGRPVFADGMHEEVAVKRSFGETAQISAAVFHDRSTHTPVMGIGTVPNSDYVQGFFGDAFAYDGGATSSTGTRFVYEQKVASGLTSTVIYDYSGALTFDSISAGAHLRDQLSTRGTHSVASRVTATIPRMNTQVMVAYKWLGNTVVSEQDPYGEATYGVTPYLNMAVRQPLPNVFPGHMAVQADMGNLLSQGTTMVTASDHQMLLVPAYKYFRGGLSFKF